MLIIDNKMFDDDGFTIDINENHQKKDKKINITVFRIPLLMAKRITVICVNGIPICAARGKRGTSEIITKLSRYDCEIKDGRINRLIEKILLENE